MHKAWSARIRAHKKALQVPADALATPCRAGQIPSPPIAADGDSSALNGTYRVEISQDDLRAAGVTDPHDREINEGIWTWTLRDGHYAFDQRAPKVTAHKEGRYTIAGNRVTFYLSWVDDLPLTFDWQRTDRQLTLRLVGQTDPILKVTSTGHPWTKIA